MKERIEKLLKILEKIESLNITIELLESNLRTYPEDFVDLIEKDRRKIDTSRARISNLEGIFSRTARSLVL